MALAELPLNQAHPELNNVKGRFSDLMVKIRSIFAKEQKGTDQKRIVIPEGRMEAPGDNETIRQNLSINNEILSVPLIRQTYAGIENEQKNLEGNYAEYTMLNTAILMVLAGFRINKDLEDFLPTIIKGDSRLNVDQVENQLIIPLISQAQKRLKNISVGEEDRTNIIEKVDNPYAALTILNTVLLFRYALSQNPENFHNSDVITAENIDQSFFGINSGVYMVGNPGHATSLLKINNSFYVIDTYTNNVAKQLNVAEAKKYLSQRLDNGAFITFNLIES